MKNALKTVGFLAVFLTIFTFYDRVMKFKNYDGIYGIQSFYKEKKNTVDVLCLGSSKVFTGLNTDILWEEYGIAAFDLAGSIQPMWNTYYFLKEALKTQNPDLVVLESYRCEEDVDWLDDYRIRVNTMGMKWSPNKLLSMMTSEQSKFWLNFMFEFVQYHGRYDRLSSDDFLPYLGNEKAYRNWKGFMNSNNFTPAEQPAVERDSVCGKMSSKTEFYYRRILELCRKRGIPVIVMNIPLVKYDTNSMHVFNEAGRVAGEYGFESHDFNSKEHCDMMGIDFATDFSDTVHMNLAGSVKFTRYVAPMIQKYGVEDRRSDASGKWDSWKQRAELKALAEAE